MAKITVVLADDNAAVLGDLRQELDDEFRIVGAAANGEEAIREVLRLDPDVLVVDITMPSLTGLEVASHLYGKHSRTKILFLTIHEEPEYISAGFSAGALGYALYVKDGKPTYEYNWFTQSRYKVTSAEKLKPGASTIRVEFEYDGGGLGKGGTVSLFVNDKKVGEGRVEQTVPGRFSADETFDIGRDTGSPVSTDYSSPNPFTGRLKRVDIKLETSPLSDEDKQKEEEIHQSVLLATH